MNWTRFGRVLWVGCGIIAAICGAFWLDAAGKSGYRTLSGVYVPPPSPGLWPLATLLFAAIAVVGAAFMLSSRDPSD